jgi:hypothetical protein
MLAAIKRIFAKMGVKILQRTIVKYVVPLTCRPNFCQMRFTALMLIRTPLRRSSAQTRFWP